MVIGFAGKVHVVAENKSWPDHRCFMFANILDFDSIDLFPTLVSLSFIMLDVSAVDKLWSETSPKWLKPAYIPPKSSILPCGYDPTSILSSDARFYYYYRTASSTKALLELNGYIVCIRSVLVLKEAVESMGNAQNQTRKLC